MAPAPDWLFNSFIYLAAAVVVVPLAKKLGLGSIIGYLVAGIAIGPWGIGLVTEVQDILHFAEFGVVLMLFLIGLELEPQRLWSLRVPIFGWGSAQVAGCMVLIALTAMAFGVSWPVALVAGLGLALSSTAMALQTLDERHLRPTPGGQAGFAVLLFQDVAAIPILALLPVLAIATAAGAPEAIFLGSNTASSSESSAQAAIKIIAIMGGIIVGGRLLVRPLLHWIARSSTPEIFTAASLLLVVGIALLMLQVGLSMALGAFLAGVLLATSEYRRELETDIEPFKGLLLGLFFIAVGMGIDFGVLRNSPGLMAAVVLGFLAIKLVFIYGLAMLMKLPVQERPVFAVLLAQGGEFAFVVFQAAAGAKLLAPQTSSILIGAVALSMLLGPLLLLAIDKLMLKGFAGSGQNRQALPEIAEPQHAPVIIAGFGRYGQIVGRMLLAEGFAPTVLDHNADTVETVRSFGYRIFYGDASRLNLLRIAGAGSAKILVLAVDDVAQSLKIAEVVKAHFPHLEIVARARDVTHWNALRDRGVQRVEREMFEASLCSARGVLELLGQSPMDAMLKADRFRQHNQALFETMRPHHSNRKQVIAAARAGRQQLEAQIAEEQAQARAAVDQSVASNGQ